MAKRAKKAVQKDAAAAETTSKKRGRRAGKRSSSGSSFARIIASERKRLEKIINKIRIRKVDIDREFEAVSGELQKIASFFTGSGGKSNGRSGSKVGSGRAGRGQRRQQVLDAITSSPEGATRGEIIEKMGVKGDKALEQSVSNALAALFKSKAVKREDGRYRAA